LPLLVTTKGDVNSHHSHHSHQWSIHTSDNKRWNKKRRCRSLL